MATNDRNLFIAAFILGLGLLGVADGIVLHQLLQWHHMVLNPNVKLEIITDGIFNGAVSILLIWGGIKIFKDARNDRLSYSWTTFMSGIFIGGGTFNLVEGIVDHHILKVHRVRPAADHPLLYDLAFLASGVLLIVIGLLLLKRTSNLYKSDVMEV